MAITLKARKTAISAGRTVDWASVSLTSGWNTTYSSATYTPVADDLIVITYVTGSTADRTLGITTAGYTGIVDIYANGSTTDTNLSVFWKKMGGTPDTAVVLGQTFSANDAGAAIIEVWGGVDTTTPIDVTSVTATGTGTGRPDPGSITPSTAGSVILVVGGGATATGAIFTQSGSELSAFISATSIDNNDAMVGGGYFVWSSGAFNPVAWTGGTTGAGDSWAAACVALRPAPNAYSMPAAPGSYTYTGTAAGTLQAHVMTVPSTGPELVTTPDLSSATGWDLFGTANVSGGVLVLPKSTAFANGASTLLPAGDYNGKRLRVQYDIVSNTYVDGFLRVAKGQIIGYNQDGQVDIAAGVTGTGLTTNWDVTHSNTPQLLISSFDGTATGSVSIDNVSVKELGAVYTLTGTDVTFARGKVMTADPGSYTYTGTVTGLAKTAYSMVADPGSYGVTGTAANLLHGWVMPVVPGSYAYTGTAVTFIPGRAVIATPGSYGLTGTAANLLRGPAVAAAPGTYSLTGTDVTLSKGTSGYTMVAEGYGPNMIPNGDASAGTTGWTNQYGTGTPPGTTTVDAGRFKVTNDQAAGLNYAYPANPYGTLGSKYRFQVDFETNRQPTSQVIVMSANYSKNYINRSMEPSLTFSVDETFVHDGTHPSISVFLGLSQTFNTADIAWFDNVQLREVAAYTLTGTDTGLLQGHSMVATPGSYSLTGTPASLLFSRNMVATPGSYSLTGTDAAFTIDTTAYFLTAVPGTYVLTGTNANLLHGWTMPAVTGAYALTGTAVNFAFGRTVAAAPGAYTYTGTSALFGRTYQIAAAAGAYAVVGTAAGLGVGVIMLADPGAYSYTGTDVAFRSYKLAADPGSYTITGWPVEFSLGDLADLVPAPDPIIVFRHQEPEIVRVPKLNALARQAALKVKTVVSMAQLVAIAPNMGLEVHVWDAPGGYAPAYADGFNWRKLSDGTVLV